jgi:hypothetical protein
MSATQARRQPVTDKGNFTIELLVVGTARIEEQENDYLGALDQ